MLAAAPIDAACINQKEGPRARYQIYPLGGRSAGLFAKASHYVRSKRTSRRSAWRQVIVILPATSYGVTYSKSGNSPNLVAKNCVPKIDAGAPMTHEEFLAKALLAANVKARELGWIA